jgi:hypothetical protein
MPEFISTGTTEMKFSGSKTPVIRAVFAGWIDRSQDWAESQIAQITNRISAG